jgi:Tfp pilus assembly protein PilO
MAGLDLETRPWYFAAIVGALIAGGLIWASESYWLKGIRQDITARTNELEELNKKIREGKAAEARLAQFREEFERLDAELQRLLRILPTAKQTDEIIKKLKSLMERGSFRFVSFQPQAFQRQEFYLAWPINVQLQGSYHELAMFFDRLSRFSRIINIESMALTGERSGAYTMSATFTMKTFIYDEPKGGGQ